MGSPDLGHHRQYLVQWAHVHEPFMRGIGGDDNHIPAPLKAAIWRKVLSSPFHRLLTDTNPNLKNKQTREHQEATRWLRNLFAKHAPGIDLVASLETTMDVKLGRQMLYELSVVNFWYQLMAINGMADSTTPKPLPVLSVANLAVEHAWHD
ncbi:hypothetical protein PQX77_013898 [Marasmius sp. AFHP31]|nr:hypothetical protein PQX77_013898 [Marasmius sp. AFHP31]